MRRLVVLTAVAALAGVVVLVVGAMGFAQGSRSQLQARNMRGFEEVPAVSTVARGSFEATINEQARQIQYTLNYSNLEGTVTQAHIHLAQRSVNGGIALWLCETQAQPRPAGSPDVPDCTPTGPISGTLTPAHIVGPAGQGIAPPPAQGEWEELLRAIRAGVTYANVHSTKFGGGEIRAQIAAREGDRDDDDD
jgi:CHRD domain